MGFYYVTRNRIAKKEKRPLLVDILNGADEDGDYADKVYRKGYSTTTRYKTEEIALSKKVETALNNLSDLSTYNLYRSYTDYKIPKKSGGYRTLSEPNPDLKKFQKKYAKLLYMIMDGAVSHTNAFAYVPDRSCKNAIERHKGNKSRWFLKLDIHDFFGSTTYEFAKSMLKKVFPFNQWFIPENFYYCFKDKFETLDDVLPQGAPTSPIISNLIMIPIDYELTTRLRAFDLVYTRYCDDILISGKTKFHWREIIGIVNEVFSKFNAPYRLNTKKSRFGSCAGRNFNLGLMYNKDQNITIGHEKKKLLKAQLVSLIKKETIDHDEINKLNGIISYYRSIEKDYIDYVIDKYSIKFNIDINKLLKYHVREEM